MSWFLLAMKRYAEFSGRSRRSEYWYFLLFVILISIALGIVDGILAAAIGFGGLLSILFGLGIIIPSLAVSVRRLHDTGRSGWWYLINFVPLIGVIIFIVFAIQDSTNGPNQYGPSPKNEG